MPKNKKQASASQVLQVQQMVTGLLTDLDRASVQRLLDGSRDVLSALADGRLDQRQVLAQSGMYVKLGRSGVLMDFIGPGRARRDKVEDALLRHGLRPASEGEFHVFHAQYPELVQDLLHRRGLRLVLMGSQERMPTHYPREKVMCHPVYVAGPRGKILRETEHVGATWGRTCRFLGVRNLQGATVVTPGPTHQPNSKETIRA